MFKECRHIFTSGKKCHSPALKDQDFCYFHSNTRQRPTPANAPYKHIAPIDHVLDLTPLEDADAIQLAISEVVLSLAANTIDNKRARTLFYGLQIASQNWRARAALAAKEAESAERQKQALTVCETHRHDDGSLIGPETQSLDPEEARERKRPPSLGQILIAEVEAMKREKAEKEAREKAEQVAEGASTDQSVSVQLPQIQASVEMGAPGVLKIYLSA